MDVPALKTKLHPLLYLLIGVSTLLGLAHHVDHIIRGNHVGWPITQHVTLFTYSLALYPLLVVGLYLTVTDRVGTRYWAGFLAVSAAMLAHTHITPWAAEPPADVILPYASPVVGSLAVGIVLALIASTAVGSAYAAVLWRRGDA